MKRQKKFKLNSTHWFVITVAAVLLVTLALVIAGNLPGDLSLNQSVGPIP